MDKYKINGYYDESAAELNKLVDDIIEQFIKEQIEFKTI